MMPFRKTFFVGLLFASFVAKGDELPLKVSQAWVQAVPPVASATAAFFAIENTGKNPLKLTEAATPIAAMVMPMITTTKMVNGQKEMGMEEVKELSIPVGGKLVLEPGGNHLMLMDLKQHPKIGEVVEITLHLEPGNQSLKIKAPVSMREPGAAQ
ncbi:MAG: copper chaperone PCu(A)C [Chthoniobacteraceae bacterium]